MARVVFTEAADADLAAIYDDLAQQAGLASAARYRCLFGALFARLADHPDSGPRRRHLGADMRIGVVWPYLVVHSDAMSADTVTIARIVHGRRKISGRLLLTSSRPPGQTP